MSAIGVMSRATAIRHATATILLHWATVLAVVVSVAAIYLRELTENDSIRVLLLGIHRQLGLLILICVPLRLAARYCLGFAKMTAGMAALLRWAASATHVVLYVSLFALPLIGWAATSAKGINLSLFGLVTLPSVIAPDPDIADALVDYHQWGAWALLAVVGVHGIAALWHHYVRSDGVLGAMLPARTGTALAAPSSAARRHRIAADADDGHPARAAIAPTALLDARGVHEHRSRIGLKNLLQEPGLLQEPLAAANLPEAAHKPERRGRVGEGEAELR